MHARRTQLDLRDGPSVVLVALLALIVVLCPLAAQLVASIGQSRLQEPLEERSEGETEAPVIAAVSTAPARRLAPMAAARVRPLPASTTALRDPIGRCALGELSLQARPLRC